MLHITLLNGGGAMLLFVAIPIYAITHLIFTGFIEGFVMKKFRFHDSWKRCFTDAVVINVFSLTFGILFFRFFEGISDDLTQSILPSEPRTSKALITFWFFSLSFFFVQTVITEFIILYLFRKEFGIKKLLKMTVLMNLITYALLILIAILSILM